MNQKKRTGGKEVLAGPGKAAAFFVFFREERPVEEAAAVGVSSAIYLAAFTAFAASMPAMRPELYAKPRARPWYGG